MLTKRNKQLLLFVVALFTLSMKGYTQKDIRVDSIYSDVFDQLSTILKGSNPSFKQSVFLVENAFYDNGISFDFYQSQIDEITSLTRLYNKNNKLMYKEKDSDEVGLTACLFKVITDSIPILLENELVYHPSCSYNFDDYTGTNDWGHMFVLSLLSTYKGNCHAMPFLYKIIADELHIKSYFAYAPNHLYIKLFNEKYGWYNVELTSAEFPIDAWIMATGYIHLDAIQHGIYMDTIGNEKAIAMCFIDLAQGYIRKTHSVDYSFVIKCCDKTLEYFPNNIYAYLLKQDACNRILLAELKSSTYKTMNELIENDKGAKDLYNQTETLTKFIYDNGYRKMPTKMYLSWLASLKTQNNKYHNNNILKFTQPKK